MILPSPNQFQSYSDALFTAELSMVNEIVPGLYNSGA